MLISPVKLYNQYQFTGLFSKNKNGKKIYKDYQNGMLEGQVLNNGCVFNRHGTLYFRPDLDWTKFGKYLQGKFSNSNKVQSLIWGCSTGNEAYSFAILLKHSFGDNSKKFLPIKAMDINSKLINQNKTLQEAGFPINLPILENMKSALKIQSLRYDLDEIKKYFKPVTYTTVRLNDEILNSVDFSYSNILTDVDKIDSSIPSIVMCRNMWPYISPRKYSSFSKKLYDKLHPNSIVVIGGYDWEGEKGVVGSNLFPKALIYNNFKPVKGFHVKNGNKSEIIVFQK